MTPEQRGYYIQLLAHAWDSDKPGTLSSDPTILWKIAGADSREDFERSAPLVLAQFRKTPDGSLVNARLVSERRSQILRKKQKKDAGKEGAKRRWDNRLDDTAIVLPIAENSPSSAFASASSSSPSVSNTQTHPGVSEGKNVFAEFWRAYPKKVNESAAFRAWCSTPGIHAHIEEILTVIMQYEISGMWDDHTKIPNAENFIRDKRWRDVVPKRGVTDNEQRVSRTVEASNELAREYGIDQCNSQLAGPVKRALPSGTVGGGTKNIHRGP